LLWLNQATTKLQAGKDKTKKSKPDMPLSCGLASAVQSLWAVTSESNTIFPGLQGYNKYHFRREEHCQK